MKKATSSFGVFHDNPCAGKPNMLIQDTILFPLVKNMFNLVTDEEALAKLNEDQNLRSTLSTLLNQYTVASNNGILVGALGSGHTDGTMFSNTL
jgi:hypothetical protein